MGAGGRYKLRIHDVGRAGTSTVFPQAVFACVIPQRLYAAWCRQVGQEDSKTKKPRKTMKIRREPKMQYILLFFDNYS